jgi:hypothetical protein
MKKKTIAAILFLFLVSGGFSSAIATDFGNRIALELCGGNGANWYDSKTYNLLPSDATLWEGIHTGTASNGIVHGSPVVFTFTKAASGATAEANCTRRQATWMPQIWGYICSKAKVTKHENMLTRPGYGAEDYTCP